MYYKGARVLRVHKSCYFVSSKRYARRDGKFQRGGLFFYLILTVGSYYSFPEYGVLNSKRYVLRTTNLASRDK